MLLDNLVNIKRMREDAAIKEMQEKQLQLDQSREALKAKVIEHDKYHEWRETESQRLYAEVLEQDVQVSRLHTLRNLIQSFKERELQLKDEIAAAEAAVEEAAQQLVTARHARMEAYKVVQKFEEYRKIIRTTETKEAERREELETEEFRTRVRH